MQHKSIYMENKNRLESYPNSFLGQGEQSPNTSVNEHNNSQYLLYVYVG